jgi:hypothetical protein
LASSSALRGLPERYGVSRFGLTLGVLLFPAILLGFGDVRLAAAVAIAIIVAGGIAARAGWRRRRRFPR